MIEYSRANFRVWSMLGSRRTLGVAVDELADQYEDFTFVTADVGRYYAINRFIEKHPEKMINVGIAEQNMIGVAAAMAKEGYNVFAASYATFITARVLDQIRVNLGLMGLGVKLNGVGAGFYEGDMSATHMGLEDIANIRAIPGITILSPADCTETMKAMEAAAAMNGPVYIRLTGVANNPIVYTKDYEYQVGRAITLREGRLIKEGYNEEVDRLRRADVDGKSWLAKLENKEKEETGIRTLKVGYNRVFGYYLEVSKSFMNQVPDRYIRKQTLANGERYITEELKNLEDTILGAKEKLLALEYDLFTELRQQIAAELVWIQRTAAQIAELDALRSLGEAAVLHHYVKPKILNDKKGTLEIWGGRHPVVEKMMKGESFIPNDTLLDGKDNRIAVITGPNMAGKSTYMRQVAVITLMAQMGSFVPADSARLCLVDRIFTRVGASDDLAGGQSTFMVEMAEVSNILRHATSDSLLILDEIGRGTATYDGLSIAWAVVEYISDRKTIGAKTLFATHYHELTELEGQLSGVHNYCVAIKESSDGIVFLRKIQKGFGDRSYGIEVAKLAGLPAWVVKRAQEILAELLENNVSNSPSAIKARTEVLEGSFQMSLFGADDPKQEELLEKLRGLKVLEMTPLEAQQTLYQLCNEAKEIG